MTVEQYLKLHPKKVGRSKYGNTKTTYKGVVFDSKKEANYAAHLDAMMHVKKDAQKVLSYERQPQFPIIIKGKKVFTYKADFRVVYADGHIEIVDIKGFKTAIYRLKKKCVEAQYGISIVEI